MFAWSKLLSVYSLETSIAWVTTWHFSSSNYILVSCFLSFSFFFFFSSLLHFLHVLTCWLVCFTNYFVTCTYSLVMYIFSYCLLLIAVLTIVCCHTYLASGYYIVVVIRNLVFGKMMKTNFATSSFFCFTSTMFPNILVIAYSNCKIHKVYHVHSNPYYKVTFYSTYNRYCHKNWYKQIAWSISVV